MTEYRDLLPVIVEQEAAVLPDGCDSWAIKSVHPDLRTRGGFQWAYPGGTSRSDHNLDRDNASPCPTSEGDGLCVATTWQGMASSLIPARTLLLVAYQSGDVLGRDDERGKLRIAGPVHVVSLIDGEQFVREHGARANLSWAYLSGADLTGAYLTGADLTRANLYRADLPGANLSGAVLIWAYLVRANLVGANLAGANLAGANLSGAAVLTGANLSGADLTGANLFGACLSGANLFGANLTAADLTEADLARADLTEANLTGARWLDLPSGWMLTDAGMAVRS